MRLYSPRRLARLAGALLLAAAAVPALCSPSPDTAGAPIPGLDPADHDVVMSDSFMRAHPDIQYRLRAVGALERGEDAQAVLLLRKAARHADKLSQAFLAQLYWTGRGVPQDRALAYAWMDLAAERGTPMLVVDRERYWNQLGQAERERAIREGKAIYAEYGDAVAQPRQEAVMRLARKDGLGSRTSNRASTLELCVGDWRIADAHLVCKRSVSADRYYQDQFWKPASYWQWQEKQMRMPQENIRIGSPVPVDKES